MKAELLDPALPACDLGEGPCWDSKSHLFYWVDISGRTIHRYNPLSAQHQYCRTPSMAGFAVPCDSGGLITGLQDGLYRVEFETGSTTHIITPDAMPGDNRFNDGKCDRRGRLWGGTMNLDPEHPKATGALYRFDKNGLAILEDDVFISNGLGWSPDNRTMYYTDTVRREIRQYDYDIETGTPSNPRLFHKASGKGRPDGLCVDQQGRVLTALWPGWGVEIYTPDGKLDGRIDLPVPQVSSCAFGGPGFKTLFITTAKIGMSDDELAEAPLSGRVFTIDLDIPGLPEQPFKTEGLF